MPNPLMDLTGQRFGKLTVVRLAPKRGAYTCWLAQCDCGNQSVVKAINLRTGETKSCGCIRRPHGRSGTAINSVWKAMWARCVNPRNRNYRHYGARGIRVCERWRRFEVFLADMGERPDGTSIDRIDNDGNYEPKNCRWATRAEQDGNRTVSIRVVHDGRDLCLSQWARELGFNPETIRRRYVRGLRGSDLFCPVDIKRSRKSKQLTEVCK